MRLKNTFVQAKMNKDIDERLLPKGQYPHAENIRVANSDGSDMGAIENVKGNLKLTNLNLTNGRTIGMFTDGSNQKIYWFVTSDTKDLVVEYDFANSTTEILLESTRPNGVLNFDKNYLITGVSKIINGLSERDLLVWTDDLNPPRIINIERAKTYGVDGFIEDDISLIKKPPRYAPDCFLTFTSSTLENNIENKFLSFAYRYKYLDGEYSALSSFSPYNFAPSEFALDYQTLENEGMVNAFNAINVEFNTGDKRVTDIELVFKESGSNNVYIVETFNKKNEGWGDNQLEQFLFSNSKIYAVLQEDELFRTYDNVPLKAKAMEVIGNRLVFGNYVEQYDLVDCSGNDVKIDIDVSLLSKDLTGEELPVSFVNTTIVNDTFVVDLTGIDLVRDSRLTFDFRLLQDDYAGSFDKLFDFIINQTYADAIALATSEEFILFVETIMTNNFLQNYEDTPPADSEILSSTGFEIVSSTSTSITIKAPTVTYRIDNTPVDPNDSDFTDVVAEWSFLPVSSAFYRDIAIGSSLKTNRSYEVGIMYMDEHNRSTPVLTDDSNTVYIPQEFSVNQNKLVINVNHKAPAWADRYKFVVKQNKGNYETIYGTLFYEDGLYRWVKLDGANKDKVKEGDTLIVKSDLSGIVDEVVKVRVIEVDNKQPDFIEDNVDSTNNLIIEEGGLYMKIKPTNFDMNFNQNTFLNYDKYTAVKSGRPKVFLGSQAGSFGIPTGGSLVGFFDTNTSQYVDYEITAGSRIRVKFRNYESDGYNQIYEKSFIVQSTYSNFEDWWNAEVVDLGSQEARFNWEFIRRPDNALWMSVEGTESGATFERSKLSCQIDVVLVEGTLIFETEPEDATDEIFYETSQTFDIVDCNHQGNTQNQTDLIPTAIVELDFFNCYVMGNGAESKSYLDGFNKNQLNIDLRPSATSLEKYRQVRRFADLTYSAVYNENTNINGLNEFNLARANFKEDIDKRYGFIQKLFSRDTDLVVFQEDKVSKVLYGKDLLLNADGTSNISSIEDVLGQQIAYAGEYGISKNPESFAYDSYNVYFTDVKRGCVLRLGLNGITEISKAGMTSFFRDQYKGAINTNKIGAFDPYYNQYIISNEIEERLIPVSVSCGQQIVRNNFSGSTMVAEIDFGIYIGTAQINFDSDQEVSYTLEWNGNTVQQTANGAGSISINKSESSPSKVKLTVDVPTCGTSFSINSVCIPKDEVTVISVILNDEFDEGLTMKSRYKWFNNTYSNPFKNYDSVFGQGELQLYESNTGDEGENFRPLTDSTVIMESYKGFSETAPFIEEENQIGYLISNTLYTDAQIADIVANATFPVFDTETAPNGDVVRRIEFNLSRPTDEQYLYMIWDYRNSSLAITPDTKIRIYFDSSGSMDSTLAPLQTMRDTILKDRLLPLYNNDSALYDQNVTVVENPSERTFDMLNLGGDTPDGNVVALVFQDEAAPEYHDLVSGISPRTASYDNDISVLRTRLNGFAPDYYRGVIFQVEGNTVFPQLIQAVQNGTGDYSGTNGLSDRIEFNYKYGLQDGGTAQYYLDQIVTALIELGYEL